MIPRKWACITVCCRERERDNVVYWSSVLQYVTVREQVIVLGACRYCISSPGLEIMSGLPNMWGEDSFGNEISSSFFKWDLAFCGAYESQVSHGSHHSLLVKSQHFYRGCGCLGYQKSQVVLEKRICRFSNSAHLQYQAGTKAAQELWLTDPLRIHSRRHLKDQEREKSVLQDDHREENKLDDENNIAGSQIWGELHSRWKQGMKDDNVQD